MSTATRVRIVSIAAFERPVAFRFPFRFGVAEVTRTAQAFIRLELEDESGRTATGWAAEMMMPKWFDKSPALSPAENVEQLRSALRLAIDTMSALGTGTAFDLHVSAEADHHARCAAFGLNGLIASFGLALVDRAVIDALGRLENVPAQALVQANALGIDHRTAPDLEGFDFSSFLAGLSVAETIGVRHTVGLGDALVARDLGARRNDGLPETLQEAVAAYGHRYFKLKIAGRPAEDVERLARIASVLDQMAPDYKLTLDGNEQYEDAAHVLDLLDRIDADPRLARLRARILFLEQPIARAKALSADIAPLAARIAVELDESDADMDAFARGKALGYTGISSKSCKGFYRAILNRARVAAWNADAPEGVRYFMSGEDLTTQAGIGLQQDLVLASLVGAVHVERNGHHFVDGMAGASAVEEAAYLRAHGDLYRTGLGRARLHIENGEARLASIAAAPGLGSAVEPDWTSMGPLHRTGESL